MKFFFEKLQRKALGGRKALPKVAQYAPERLFRLPSVHSSWELVSGLCLHYVYLLFSRVCNLEYFMMLCSEWYRRGVEAVQYLQGVDTHFVEPFAIEHSFL